MHSNKNVISILLIYEYRMENKMIIISQGIAKDFNAGSKAPMDVLNILKDCDQILLQIRWPFWNKLKIKWLKSYIGKYYIRSKKKQIEVNRDCIFVLQYPIYSVEFASIFDMLIGEKLKVIAIVHDVNSLRYAGKLSEYENGLHIKQTIQHEVEILNSFSVIIVHSQEMLNRLRCIGVNTPAIVLGLFDYLLQKEYSGRRMFSRKICFAGNLTKSIYLQELPKIAKGNIEFLLYGKWYNTLPVSDLIKYQGKFFPNDVSEIKGSWGLIWDGESAGGLEGLLGEYLKFISPHKASLYLVAHLPIIAPKNTAIGRLIEEKELGITVSSLYEIEERLMNFDSNDYDKIMGNVCKYAECLEHGQSLLAAIEKATRMIR